MSEFFDREGVEGAISAFDGPGFGVGEGAFSYAYYAAAPPQHVSKSGGYPIILICRRDGAAFGGELVYLKGV